MKTLTTCLLMALVITCSAQYAPILKGKISLSRFNKSETQVVLTDNEELNKILKTSIETSWNLTNYSFIDATTFAKNVSDPSLSFIYINSFKVKGEKKEVGAIALFNGGFSETDFYLNSSLAYVVYDNWGIEKNKEDIIYKLPIMVEQLKQTIKHINDNNIEGKDEADMIIALNKIYNQEAGLLKTKTLLIDKRYIMSKIVSLDELLAKYGYNIEIVSKEVIKDAITGKSENKAVLLSCYNLYKINTVIDCSTYHTIYAEFEQDDQYMHSLDKFDLADIELLNSVIKKAKN